MTKITKEVSTKVQTTATPSNSTKDKGTVQIGGAAIRFACTNDSGIVKVGGAAIRF